MTPTRTLNDQQRFFFDHAGYSKGPGENEESGRTRCAEHLAACENFATHAGCSFQWSVDPDSSSCDWRDDGADYPQWRCVCRDAAGCVVASLHGIDFGPDGDPYSDPYRRVVQAELASEYCDQVMSEA